MDSGGRTSPHRILGSVPSSSAIPGYEDWPTHASAAAPFAAADPRSQELADVFGLRERPVVPQVDRGASVEVSGLLITPLRWRMPYGPPTQAWELRPKGARGPLPGILALHPHGGRRSIGAAQLVDLVGDRPEALANRLARSDAVVLAHDTFSWASRSFDLTRLPPKLAHTRDALLALWAADGHAPSPEEEFDAVSSAHEELIAKAAGALGQTFAGMVLADDLVALDVLAGLDGVDAARLATVGFSGGGGRAQLAGALDPRVGATVIGGMMATFESLMPDYIEAHSWLLHSPGLPRVSDWPDIARIGRPRELFVLYGERDPLFPPAGMRAAHELLLNLPGYRGRFFDAGHELTREMVDAIVDFLRSWREDAAPIGSASVQPATRKAPPIAAASTDHAAIDRDRR
ncbi:acetylesterase [Planctomonas sp. JC2975]|uniref:dienelactone hydrolase family protein n=1 Tax=Planctomonas sp. JC2975 TaxID=2729626 RepID=UPI0014737CF1|nr:acetylesterase [Planctomonas sp. JC2975]NNC13905.1 acetylesterase [Planctomonas sp. JC2975]